MIPCGCYARCLPRLTRCLPRATDSSPSRWENLGCLVLYQQHVTLLNWCHNVGNICQVLWQPFHERSNWGPCQTRGRCCDWVRWCDAARLEARPDWFDTVWELRQVSSKGDRQLTLTLFSCRVRTRLTASLNEYALGGCRQATNVRENVRASPWRRFHIFNVIKLLTSRFFPDKNSKN